MCGSVRVVGVLQGQAASSAQAMFPHVGVHVVATTCTLFASCVFPFLQALVLARALLGKAPSGRRRVGVTDVMVAMMGAMMGAAMGATMGATIGARSGVTGVVTTPAQPVVGAVA